jgi:hypothetical protein
MPRASSPVNNPRGSSRAAQFQKLEEWQQGVFREDRPPYTQPSFTRELAKRIADHLLITLKRRFTCSEWALWLIKRELGWEDPVPEPPGEQGQLF